MSITGKKDRLGDALNLDDVDQADVEWEEESRDFCLQEEGAVGAATERRLANSVVLEVGQERVLASEEVAERD